jgi:AcrR family transcriptional regulator
MRLTQSIKRVIELEQAEDQRSGMRQVQPARERILQAACALFSRQNVEATSIRDLAGYAGVNSQLIYHYFRDKQGLCRAVVDREASRIRSLLEKAVQRAGSPGERLAAFIHTWVTITVNHADSVRLVFRITQSSDARHQAFVKKRSFQNARLMQKLIREGIESGDFRRDVDPRMAVASLAGMVFFLATAGEVLLPAAGLGQEKNLAEKLARHSADLFLHGISKSDASSAHSRAARR